jgi:superfamily II DNA/RNA helicase
LNMLKTIIKNARNAREKVVVISRSNTVAAELLDELSNDPEVDGVLLMTTQLSVHEINQRNDQFTKTPEANVLLVTDAVNTGLDFTAANHLVHYDYPARYTDILQRNNRIARQTSHHREAAIYYLITSGKIDEFDYGECMKENKTIDRARSTV